MVAPTPYEIDGIHILPVVHERFEYAGWVRRVFAAIRPDALAIELPSSLQQTWMRAVERLPAISVLLYETGSGRTVYLPVHPCDPMVEAARLARAAGIDPVCADLDVDGYADYRDPVPDSYSVTRLGLPRVYEAFRAAPRRSDPSDAQREASMAHHARRLRADGAERVLLLCGMHHAENIAKQVALEQATPLTPPRRRNLRLVHLHPDSLSEVLPEPPFYAAAYETARAGLPPADPPVAVPSERLHGPFRVIGGGRDENPADSLRAIRASIRSAAVVRDDGDLDLDRLKLQWAMLGESERSLVAQAPDETVQRWQRRNLARFSRNLALLEGQLVPDLFDLLVAARGCISDNFAWELNRIAATYPAQVAVAPDLPTVRIRADEMFEGTRRIQLHRRSRRPKRPDWKRLLREKRRERWSGEWLEGFDSDAICSYPPEDVVIEDFGGYLRRRGKQVLSEERSRVVPFTTSVLDGIDIRETIRHWSERQIYVREMGRAPGEVGSVVIVFDDDADRFPYCQTWIGEHDQESDMAFFSTDPAQGIVGPGICRVTYGGLLLSYPPRRMADVWIDADYRLAESRAEVLLLAALDYCAERTVVYVAQSPPRAVLFRVAESLGLKIQYLPLGTLSPSMLKKIRVMHILSGHDKRETAGDYIW